MNKQQLANKIWAAANKMRSKIEANEYKDYILGFIFYRFLSNKEEQWLRAQGWDDESMLTVTEEDVETLKYVQDNLGYFIGYNNLFSTWLGKGRDFGVKDVTDALSAFNRLINPVHKKVYKDIFETLSSGLKNLGDNDINRSSAISKLINLIKDIPMEGRQGYDVLGYIYEYLISNFAASAGKKAGEFYTPHEVSELMAEIVAYHLRDRERIEIYDPTSGSGSLLITIGSAFAKYNSERDNIKYYAQELKKPTYNLTRMNLVMRDIKPNNIVTRNGDTLQPGCDWPYFNSDEDREITYEKISMDAVVSNPPYSQEWDRPADKDSDPRYKYYGLAPKKPADFAFLLHDLYHLKDNGIMAIVLPHGVLFRPGDEAEIRQNLIEEGNIEAIIGLPADIFFGTPIATVVMILKKKRNNTDVLFIDASKHSSKDGKKKKLRAADIKRIFDVVVNRPLKIEKFSRIVSRDEIRANNYDLNIHKYVDSSEPIEHWDLYSSLLGGVPRKEIEELHHYWAVMPTLRSDLFTDGEYAECKVADVNAAVAEHPDVKKFNELFRAAFANYGDYLHTQLIDNMASVNIVKELDILGNDLYERLENVPLIDRYTVYQSLSDCWEQISADLELIQTEGTDVIRAIEPNLVVVKNGDEENEVQKGWRGRIMPFNLVQETLLPEDVANIKSLQNRLSQISADLNAIIEDAGEEDEKILKEDSDAIDPKKVDEVLKEVLKDVVTPEIATLQDYCELTTKKDKVTFIAAHSEINWMEMEAAKDGTYPKKTVAKLIHDRQAEYDFPEGTFEQHVVLASRLLAEQKQVKFNIKAIQTELEQKTIWTIEWLTDEQVELLLKLKWIDPIYKSIQIEMDNVLTILSQSVINLLNKYAITAANIESQISDCEKEFTTLLKSLGATNFDKTAIETLISFHKGEDCIIDNLFPKVGQTRPSVRFQGFSEDWVEVELNTIADKVTQKNTSEKVTRVFTNSATLGIIDQSDYFDKSIANINNISGYYILENEAFVYNPRTSTQAPVGPINMNKTGNTGIVSPLYLVFKTHDVDPGFLEYYFKTNLWHKYMRFNGGVGARGDRFSIKTDLFFTMPIMLPKDIEEQKLIRRLIDVIVKLTKLQDLRLQKYKNLKASFLDKLFI